MRPFKPYPNERDSVKQTRERSKKPCNFDQKIPVKFLSHYPLVLPSKKFTILELFAEPFPTESKPSKCPTKEKTGERKAKEAGRGESKKQKTRGQRNFLERKL